MEDTLRSLTLEFFGTGQHNTNPEKLFAADDAVLLDVRSHEEVGTLSFPLQHHSKVTTLHIPINEIPDRITEIPQDKLVAVFCPAGVRAAITFAYLLSQGYTNVRVLEGGYPALTDAMKPGLVFKALQN